MSPQTPPLDRRDLYKDRRHDRPAGTDAPRYSYSSRDYSRRAPSGYYRSYPDESGSRGGTPSRSDRFWYEEQQHSSYHRGYSGRYERGRMSSRDSRGGSFRRSPRYDPYHHHSDFQRRSSPNYEPYHHHTDYQRRSPNYEPYHHDSYPSDHSSHRHPHHHQVNLRSVAVPLSSFRLNSDEYYYRRQSSERRSDWERERQSSERRSDWERERDRDRKRDDGPARWSRTGKGNPAQESENPGKRIPDFKNPEDDIPSKKARLGWGQGLAKYEKQKVGDPVEPSNSKGVFGNNNLERIVELEREREGIVGLERESEKEEEKDSEGLENGEIRCEVASGDVMSCQAVIGLEAMSCQALIGREEDIITREVIPVTENEEKSSSKTENKECGEIVETENKECGEIDEIPILPLPNLDISDGNSNLALASFLTNLVAPAGHGSLRQLSESKEDISKQLEVTETEIDLLETELKSLDNNNDNINENIIIIPSPELVINDNNLPKPDSEERETSAEITPVQELSIKTLLNAQLNPNLTSQILASNSESSNKANSIFGRIEPDPPHQQFEILVDSIKSQNEKETKIKERIKAQKKEIKLKEMILARKFRIFRRIWKEELKLISDKKSRKSNCRERNTVNRNRYFSSTGNLTPLATKKAFDLSRMLMSSESPSKLYRPHLNMPSLILSQTERNNSKFLSSNGLIFDPVSDAKEKSKSNPWTQFEKETFVKMLCTFGKDFTKISSFLPHKITADCVEFYYKNHKSEWFCEAMKRFSVENIGDYEKLKKKEEPKVLTGGSSDYLGSASTGGNNNNNNNNNNRKRKREINPVSVENLPKKNSRNNSLNKKKRATADLPVQVKLKSNASEFRKRVNSSKKTKSADLAIKPNPNPNSSSPDLTKSSEGGMSSCITNAINYPNPNFDENNYEYCSDDGWREVESNEWTEEEKKLFVKGLAIYGKDFVKISACVETRNTEQCKAFFSKSWKCLSLEAGFSVNENPGIGNPGIGIPDLKGSSSEEVEREEKVNGDVKIFGRIIACQNGNNVEIKDAIISVL